MKGQCWKYIYNVNDTQRAFTYFQNQFIYIYIYIGVRKHFQNICIKQHINPCFHGCQMTWEYPWKGNMNFEIYTIKIQVNRMNLFLKRIITNRHPLWQIIKLRKWIQCKWNYYTRFFKKNVTHSTNISLRYAIN